MGTKRPSWTLFDTQPNQNKAVLPHQSDARISGEPSQRPPGTTGPSDRGRGRLREEERRGAREPERMNPRNKRKDGEPMDWYPGREPVPGPGTRGEREWMEREREKVEEKLRNGRLVSYSEYDLDQVAKKGGTFPRMRNGSREQAKIMTALREEEMDRDRKALTERPRRTEIEREPEREGDRARRTERHGDRERYRERERDGGRPRVKDEGRPSGGERPEERPAPQRERPRDPDHRFPERRREREGDTSDLRDRREREIARERERSKLSVGDRVSKAPSPRRRDREGYFESERENWERATTRDGKRDTKSEGDSDGGAGKRLAKDRERESHHSRSEGDTERNMRNKGRDVPRYRDDERQRPREARQRDQAISSEKTRDLYRERDRRKERDFADDSRRSDTTVRDRKERRPEDRQRASDEREWERHRYREEEERKYRARAEEERRYRDRRERPADPRQHDPGTGNAGKPVSETPPKALPRDQSSGEWSSDLDSEIRQTWTKDSYEERESVGESTAESDRDVGRDRSEAEASRCVDESERLAERRGERTGPVPQHRRMWLEPQRRKCSKDSSLEDEFVEARTGLTDKTMGQERKSGIEGGKERGRQLEEPYRRLSEEGRQVDRPRDPKEETEGVSVDAEEFLAEREKEVMESPLSAQGRGFRDAGQGGVKDGVKQGERDPGSDCTRSESEGGSETGWDLGRDKVLSGEDGFITVSSGGDEEDEREEFEDCSEFWEDGHSYHGPQAEEMGRRNRQREDKEYVIEEEENEEEAEATPPGTEMPPKYVFCVIGQTEPLEEHSEPSETDQQEKVEDNVPGSRLPCDVETAALPLHDTHPVLSCTTELHDGDDQHTPDSTRRQPTEDPSPSNESSYTAESASLMDVKYRETGVRTERDPEHPYAEIRAVSRDEQTEHLLVQWRDKQSEYRGLPESSPAQEGPDRVYADTRGDVVVSQENSVPLPTHPQTTQPEDVRPGEAEEDEEDEVSIRVRMSGAWGMEEEAKRRSQAPHLKWAKNVVRKILGSSWEECGIDEDTPSSPGNLAELTRPEVGDQAAGLEGHTKPDTTATSGDGQESLGSDQDSGPEVDEGNTEPLESEELRGRAQSRRDMHAESCADMHGINAAYTHTDTRVVVQGPEIHVDREAGDPQNPRADGTQLADGAAGGSGEGEGDGRNEVEMMAHKEAMRAKEVEMYLSVSNTLYKPRSCPCLNYDSDANPLHGETTTTQHSPGQEGVGGPGEGEKGEKGQATEESSVVVLRHGGSGSEEEQGREWGQVGELAEGREATAAVGRSCSLLELGTKGPTRRGGFRKTTERRKEEHVEEEKEEEEEEGDVGRDRRTRIFSATDEESAFSETWGEDDLRNVLDKVGRNKRNSKIFNAAQLYQQYSEQAQNIEILRQSHFTVVPVHAECPAGPPPSGPPTSAPPAPPSAPASRPLPPLPLVPHPHSLSSSLSSSRSSGSAKNLPLPETPKAEPRPPSPRLSVSLGQSTSLWQDLPAVRNSTELGQLSEDQRRLQEVRFEVVTSEASYCRSLDIVVEHFVKSKQLGVLLTTQDRSWLFSRFADVRAISHSFLSKLEEKVESDMLQFTVCDVIARHCQRFKMVYVPYLTNQSYQDATYQRLMNENQRFKRVVEKLERSPVCQRLPLRSFLILPFQRITRIKLLVQNIVKRTAPGTEEVVQAIKALKLLEKMIQESNDSISQMKSIESLVSLSAMVDFECKTLPLVSQSRRLVREGPVTELMEFSVKDTERSIYLHLFNDHLLLSLHKEGGRFTVIDHSPVSDLRAENCRVKLHSLQKNLFRLHLSQKALLLRTDTQNDKLRWISAISRPQPEVDFSAAQDFTQMQCIRAFVTQQPDELSLEKADVILVHQQSGDGWVEGTKLSDRHRGWMPESHLETITNSGVCQRNLQDALKLTTATAAV
ncbi:unnamed protein product [Arctogadus glacialis]